MEMLDDVIRRIVKFRHTNESLRSVRAGLDTNGDDSVLAICGGLDQSCALIEDAGRVVAVDNAWSQFLYSKNKWKKLKRGDYEGFLNGLYRDDIEEHFRSYFSMERFEKIRARCEDIEIRKADFFSGEIDVSDFNKVYLSNACAYVGTDNLKSAKRWFNDSLPKMPKDSLFYFSEFPLFTN